MNTALVDAQTALTLTPNAIGAAPVGLPIDDEEFARPASLREQPAWMRDGILLSARARIVLERVRTVVIRVLAYWDHERRHISIGGSKISIDASGSYRRG